MKFGKRIRAEATEKWADQYFDYKVGVRACKDARECVWSRRTVKGRRGREGVEGKEEDLKHKLKALVEEGTPAASEEKFRSAILAEIDKVVQSGKEDKDGDGDEDEDEDEEGKEEAGESEECDSGVLKQEEKGKGAERFPDTGAGSATSARKLPMLRSTILPSEQLRRNAKPDICDWTP
eukprot:756428-Hanusia_phi.AAC.3